MYGAAPFAPAGGATFKTGIGEQIAGARAGRIHRYGNGIGFAVIFSTT